MAHARCSTASSVPTQVTNSDGLNSHHRSSQVRKQELSSTASCEASAHDVTLRPTYRQERTISPVALTTQVVVAASKRTGYGASLPVRPNTQLDIPARPRNVNARKRCGSFGWVTQTATGERSVGDVCASSVPSSSHYRAMVVVASCIEGSKTPQLIIR